MAKLHNGDKLGPYIIDSLLAEGGMGDVYIGLDPKLARRVALKTLPSKDADEEGRTRFSREAVALARIAHENVVQVFASGDDQGQLWMSLAYIEGNNLANVLDGGPLDEVNALLLTAQAARGLAAVHEVGVVHRDVKPENLILDEDGTVKVTDFGVAYFSEENPSGGFRTQPGTAVGTPHFMSPEQARGLEVTEATDVWGLGCTLFCLLTGAPPYFESADEPTMDILARILRSEPQSIRNLRPEVTDATENLLKVMLHPDHDRRPTDMLALADGLENIADGIDMGTLSKQQPAASAEVREATPAVAEVPPQKERSSRLGVGFSLIAAAVLVGAIIYTATLDRSPKTPDALPSTAQTPPSDRSTRMKAEPLSTGPQEVPSVAAEIEPTKPEVAAQPSEGFGGQQAKGKESLRETLRSAADAEDVEAALAAYMTTSESSQSVLAEIARLRDGRFFGVAERALHDEDTGVALAAVEALAALRNVKSINALGEASKSHRNKAVRSAAGAAKNRLFSVSE